MTTPAPGTEPGTDSTHTETIPAGAVSGVEVQREGVPGPAAADGTANESTPDPEAGLQRLDVPPSQSEPLEQQPQRGDPHSPAEAQAGGTETPDVPDGFTQTGMQPGPGSSDSPGQPAVFAGHPDAGTEQAPGTMPVATSNESPQMAPGAQTAAAKSHAVLGHIAQVIEQARADIERWVPAPMLRAAEVEVNALVRSLL